MKQSTFEKYKLVVDEWFINSFNGTKAYQKYYTKVNDETAAVKFHELVRIGKVNEYKQQKAKDAASKMNITLEGQLFELDRIKALAEDKKSFSDSLNAIKEQNKLLALYKEHNEQKGNAFSLPLTEFFKTVLNEDK